jgi:hypothetical protein
MMTIKWAAISVGCVIVTAVGFALGAFIPAVLFVSWIPAVVAAASMLRRARSLTGRERALAAVAAALLLAVSAVFGWTAYKKARYLRQDSAEHHRGHA